MILVQLVYRLVHIDQRSTPIKGAQNNRLHVDLNRLLSSNKNNTPIMTTPKDKTSENWMMNYISMVQNIDVLMHYTISSGILPKHGENLLIEGTMED